MITEIRWLERNGERVLQVREDAWTAGDGSDWLDVPTEHEKPKTVTITKQRLEEIVDAISLDGTRDFATWRTLHSDLKRMLGLE